MKIWQVGEFWSPHRVDGVANAGWVLFREQARLGHELSLIIDSAPDAAAVEIAADAGIRLVPTSRSILRFGQEVRRLLAEQAPDVVHMHSVFIPQQAVMARVLRQHGIPYVITPHGGLLPQVLKRGTLKKGLYGALVERRRFMGASAISVVVPGAERAVHAYLPHFDKPVRWIPNPIAIEELGQARWHSPPADQGSKRIAFLGRFDVLHKGIDILVEIARLLPEVPFDLFGAEHAKTRGWLERLKRNLPANMAFHEPVFGPEKGKVLAASCLYVQPSRWEGFPVSVAECLYLGVPCAITEALHLAQIYREYDLGLLIPLEPRAAAARIRAALADETRMREWSRRGQRFAEANLQPRAVAEKHLAVYEEAIESRRSGRARFAGSSGNGATQHG